MQRIPTKKQAEIINDKAGLFTVRACPGSGKTYVVAARLDRLLLNWKHRHQGIATISFTNVAWKEIENYLISDFGMDALPEYPHFIGTIDRFINTYIFLPFGHLVLGCSGRPALIGPPHDNYEPIGNRGKIRWRYAECNKQCNLNDFTYDENDILIHKNNKNLGQHCKKEPALPCVAYKKSFLQKGLATQLDANYIAFKVLQRFPDITNALVERFPMVMVDEAQDTSRIQMRILDMLIEHGVREMMLVGDPDQAIFEWRDAEPQLFLEKCKEWKEDSEELIENWRSSQSICDFASQFSTSPTHMLAANPYFTEDKEREFPPKIWGYSDIKDLPSLMNRFIKYCGDHGILEDGVNILTRSNGLLNDIKPGTIQPYNLEPWNDSLSKSIAKSKYLYDNGNFGEAFHVLQREMGKHKLDVLRFNYTDLEVIYDEIGFGKWRASLFEILSSLPSTDRNLSQWISEVNQVLQRNTDFHDIKLTVKRNSGKCRYGDLSFEEAFGQSKMVSSDSECYLGSVHSVKGQSLDAVILFLTKKAGRGPYYRNLLGKNIEQEEELRIVYVAITRARHLLVITVPKEDSDYWKQHFNISQVS